MFKIDEQVLIKEVHKKYGRTTSTIEMLESIQEQGLVGKVITTDVSDSMLNIYVSFEGADTNIWFNNEELTKYFPFRLLNGTMENILEGFERVVPMKEETTVVPTKQNYDELNDDMKIALFDYVLEELMEGKGIEEKSSLYEELMLKYMVDYYADILIDDSEFVQDRLSRSETREVVRYLLNEFSYDFGMSIEEMIKKFK